MSEQQVSLQTGETIGVETADEITVLVASKRMVKTWRADGSVSPYDEAKNFSVESRRVTGIEELSKLLVQLESNQNACIIRGNFVGFKEACKLETLEQPDKVFRRNSLYKDEPLHTILIEVDDFVPKKADPVLEPNAAIEEYITTCLPLEFCCASYHWQLSNSAGRSDKRHLLKAHLWFWLSVPYTSAQLKAWATAIGLKSDHSVFQKIQCHYTGRPVFEHGVVDPVPVRCGYVSALVEDAVRLNIGASVVDGCGPERATRAEMLKEATHKDPIAQRMLEKGLVKNKRPDGGLNIICPFEGDHSSGESSESGTAYWPAHTGGYEQGGFSCKHEHCSGRSRDDFLEAIGLGYDPRDDFEAIPQEAIAAEIEKRLARFTPAPDSEFKAGKSPGWLVKKVLPMAELGVIFGASGSGKSFWALDLVGSIARGLDWCGRRTKPGKVVYIAAEGASGFRNRINAYCEEHGIDNMGIYVIAAAPNFTEVKDITDLTNAIRALGPVDLVVVDTLAQVSPGANENSGEDMGRVLGHCGTLNKVTGAMVLLIHHAGKDLSRGARGWSGIKAGLNVEIEITREGNNRTATVTKLRDGEGEGEQYGFVLKTVPIGMDEDGDVISSCVVEHGAVVAPKAKEKAMGEHEKTVLRVAKELQNKLSGVLPRVDDVIAAAINETLPGRRDRRRELVTRAFYTLGSGGKLEIISGGVAVGGGK